jgi:hypothetical protein
MMNWKLFALRAIWPIALALWVLIPVFVLAVIDSYEQAFLRLDWSRRKVLGSWKPKLGIVLAIGLKLRWIHEAAKGGTFHIARADSVRSAFQAARNFKAERIAEKRHEDAYQADLIHYAGLVAGMRKVSHEINVSSGKRFSHYNGCIPVRWVGIDGNPWGTSRT